MAKDILDYFERELTYLKQEGAQFAERYPGVAGHLRLSNNEVEDPHVSRLLEGVAYLNAGLQQRLDDDFCDLSDALLNQLYPHYQDPVPSFCVVEFTPNPEQNGFHCIAAGTALETRTADDQLVKFTTLQSVALAPFSITAAQFRQRPFNLPGSNVLPQAESCLQISLQSAHEGFQFNQWAPGKIKFFLRAPFRFAALILERLGRSCCGIVVEQATPAQRCLQLAPSAIRLCGYQEDEVLLPYRTQAQAGYRLLSEFFLFPEKFLFFELDISAVQSQLQTAELNLVFYFRDASQPDLEQQLNAGYFALNCTPAANLFREVSEPVKLDHTRFEYPLQPPVSYVENADVIQVEAVESVATDTHQVLPVQPLYGLHGEEPHAAGLFWHCRRKTQASHSQLLLSLTDLNLAAPTKPRLVLYAQLLCSNGDLPESLPVGGGQPLFQAMEVSVPLQAVRGITPPTPSLRQATGASSRWKLISHLNLNLLSLNSSAEGLLVLKEILQLYNFRDSAGTRQMIHSLLRMQVKPCLAAMQIGLHTCMVRGLEIDLEVDENGFAGMGLFLFGDVLQHFFALYCSINSFVQLTLRIQGKDGIFHQWKPLTGMRNLI